MDRSRVCEVPFVVKGWVLHRRWTRIRGGLEHYIYFFVKEDRRPLSGEPCDLPEGYEVGFVERRPGGMPFLRRSREGGERQAAASRGSRGSGRRIRVIQWAR